MYGRPPQQALFEQMYFFDTDSHHHHLQAKLAEMRDFIEANLVESADKETITISTLKLGIYSRESHMVVHSHSQEIRPSVGW